MLRRDRSPRKGGLVQKGVRGISGGVGLISESIKAHRESKAAEKSCEEVRPESNTKFERIDHPDFDNDEAEGAGPPSYSSTQGNKRGYGQYPDEKADHTQSPDASFDQNLTGDASGVAEDALEDEWNLDDAQDEIIGDSPDKAAGHNAGELADDFIHNHPPPEYTEEARTGKLTLPVVLPQRRPKERSRGFIRAYAPVLENCGINQNTWLSFLDTFQKSSVANPWLNAINLASIGAIFLPMGVGIAVSYAIRQVTNIAIELQARDRTNGFLHKTNEEFFRPRGLYCLVMTWNPESTHRVEQVNVTANIATHSTPSASLAGVQRKFRGSDGNTHGEWEFPEVAPLVFPALDQLASQTSEDGTKQKKKMAKGYAFVADYWDKRATAEYAKANPNSTLAEVPQAKFNSRYADPNNPAASGSLISFVSGGHLVPGPQSRGLIGGVASVVGQAVRGEKQGAEWARYNAQPHELGMGRRHGRTGVISGPIGAYKKLLKQNVLYLMVVNMPSNKEMAAARAAIQSR